MLVRISLIGFLLLCCVAATAQTAPPEIPKFTVSRYEVTGTNPLTPDATLKVLEPFIGQHEGLEGLQAAADELEQKLRSEGFSFHRVVLPPQTLRDGVVRLEVVEFPLDEVNIEGNRYFSKANIIRSLPGLDSARPPNLNKLARTIQLANQHPAKNVTLGFKESEKAQAVDANVKVTDRSPHTAFTVLQNTGSEDTGDYRLTLGYQYSNLFDRDHSIALVYTTAPDETDAIKQYGFSYRMPMYSLYSALSLSYSDSDIESGLIDTGASASGDASEFFNLTGKGTAIALNYSYFLPGTSNYQHELKVSYEDKLFENDLFFEGESIPTASALECVEVDGRVRTNPLGVSYNAVVRGNNNAFGYSLGFYSNQSGGSYSDDLAYNCVKDGSKSDWSATRYSFNYDQRFGAGWLMRFRLQGQAAGDLLVPGEQFGVGGATTVRGYDERSILGDEGWYTNLELWTPGFANNSMNALVFYDIGHTETGIYAPEYYDSEIGATVPASTTLYEVDPAGAGLGLRWVWNRQLSMRLDVAVALEDYDSSGATGEDSSTDPTQEIDIEAGDTTFHFNLNYRF
ncbi:MAG: ShlB/FhaC/HecB family hemolysin secretion/activation protein [Gammaproteobacteria bacterium]|nr:ShlB/FhaC/HecB family hemolysin secretion/activation protein [Gammaproteobacteria bacterium]